MKEIIGDDYPTYEDSVNETLDEAFEDSVNRENEYVNLQKENRELKHRLSCIESDIKIIGRHIENTCPDQFEQPSRNEDNCKKYEDNSVYTDVAWHNISNIEVACDLDVDECMEWESQVKVNNPNK
jgi:hypothetical protein